MSSQINPFNFGATERVCERPSLEQKVRTLIVDDVPSMLDALCAVLELDDVVEIVGRAADGTEAVAAVAQLRPELVLMDVAMPRMNGLEAARIITIQFPETKVVLMSGEDSAELRQQCRSTGADAFLFKLAFPEDLVTALRDLFPYRSTGKPRCFPE